MYRRQFSWLSWALFFWTLPWWGKSWVKISDGPSEMKYQMKYWSWKYFLQCLAKMLMRECGCKPHSHLNITMYQMKNPDSSRMRNCTLYDQIFCISKSGLKRTIVFRPKIWVFYLNKSNRVNSKRTTVPWKTTDAPKAVTMIDQKLV